MNKVIVFIASIIFNYQHCIVASDQTRTEPIKKPGFTIITTRQPRSSTTVSSIISTIPTTRQPQTTNPTTDGQDIAHPFNIETHYLSPIAAKQRYPRTQRVPRALSPAQSSDRWQDSICMNSIGFRQPTNQQSMVEPPIARMATNTSMELQHIIESGLPQ